MTLDDALKRISELEEENENLGKNLHSIRAKSLPADRSMMSIG